MVFILLLYGRNIEASSKVRGYLEVERVDSGNKIQESEGRGRGAFINASEEDKDNTPLVLGVSRFFDGALLRDKDKRIYIIENGLRRHLKNLLDLQRFRGRQIFDVDDASLSEYLVNPFSDGVLLRGRDLRIYFIKNGKRKHILNLEELRSGYAGQEIFDVSDETIEIYN